MVAVASHQATAHTPFAADTTKGIGTIWIVDVATGRSVKIGEHATPYLDELPSWFPDGKRIAFQSDRTGRWEIWLMNVDGSGARQLTR
jgi:TolB protein